LCSSLIEPPAPTTQMSDRVVCIVPAWNESASIEKVVRSAVGVFAEVIVVDDGSTDGTGLIARQAGARVLRHPTNLGVCAALQTALTFATRQQFSCVVQIDGDGQHSAQEAQRLSQELLPLHADLTIGSRFAGEHDYVLTGPRRLGVALLQQSTKFLTGTKFTDPSSGLRAFSYRLATALSHDFPDHYLSDTYEVLCAASRAGYHVCELPVSMSHRAYGDSSASNINAGLRLLRSLAAMHLGMGFRLPALPLR
jgi:glycosyltransferase involved in cell wall biosynthesis